MRWNPPMVMISYSTWPSKLNSLCEDERNRSKLIRIIPMGNHDTVKFTEVYFDLCRTLWIMTIRRTCHFNIDQCRLSIESLPRRQLFSGALWRGRDSEVWCLENVHILAQRLSFIGIRLFGYLSNWSWNLFLCRNQGHEKSPRLPIKARRKRNSLPHTRVSPG